MALIRPGLLPRAGLRGAMRPNLRALRRFAGRGRR